MAYRKINEIVPFDDDSFTERGERVYKSLKITLLYPNGGGRLEKVLQPDMEGIGLTEEWIEDTIKGCLDKLREDFPWDTFMVLRIKPNDIVFTSDPGSVN